MRFNLQTLTQIQGFGPYPPPALVKEYQALMPGFLERVVAIAEKAQADQTLTVLKVQDLEAEDRRRVHWLAFAMSIAAVTAAVVCAYFKQQVVATALVGLPVFAVIKALIDSLRSKPAQPGLAQVQLTPDQIQAIARAVHQLNQEQGSDQQPPKA
jgi:uncharacterized membrane protein